jgi:Beta-propeller repeat
MSFPLTDGKAVRRFPFWRLTAVFLFLGMTSEFTVGAPAQAPYFRWAKRILGTADDVSNAIAVDGGGNNYITGYYKSTSTTFGATVLASAGGAEVFVAKYDYLGNALWARRAGGTAEDVGNGIAVDGTGNIYVTGYYLSTNINFSGVLLTNAGSAEIFVAKYNSAGTLLWAKAAGGSGYDAANAIAVDAAGNCYITGFFTAVLQNLETSPSPTADRTTSSSRNMMPLGT